MTHDPNWLLQVVAKDPRYRPAAYEFLFEALEFTRDRLAQERAGKVKHVTGRELLEGVRRLALEQFGLMAKTVLNEMGIYTTSDVGELVFNLVETGDIEKTEQDSRADFDNVYDFEEAFARNYRIELDELGS